MEREKVIELAKQAGFRKLEDGEGSTPWHRFARLVEQETLERVARLAKAYRQHGYDVTGNLELHEAILHKDFQDF